MNHSVNRVYALCLLAALVATPLATSVISYQRNCAIQKSPGIEGVWNKAGLIAEGPVPIPRTKRRPIPPTKAVADKLANASS